MSYHYSRKKKSKNIFFFIGALLLLLILFTPLTKTLYSLFEQPLLVASTNSSFLKSKFTPLFSARPSREKLFLENKRLREENMKLQASVLKLEHLDALAKKIEEYPGNQVLAAFVSRPHENSVILNKGAEDTVSVGDSVFSPAGILLGEIKEVFDRSSVLALLPSVDLKTEAVLFPSEKSIELLGNGNALVAKLSRDTEVSVGDLVFSQSHFGTLLGSIAHVSFDPRDPVKEIFVAPAADIYGIQLVSIRK